MKRFVQARVNGGSNYDSLKVAKCLVIQLVTRMNGFVRFPLSLSISTGTGLTLVRLHEWINEIPTVPIYYLEKPQPRETGLG